MKNLIFRADAGDTHIINGAGLHRLIEYAPPRQSIIITDTNVKALYGPRLPGYRFVTIDPGESKKTLKTVEQICRELIGHEADRNTILIGFGGGIVCDITGLTASLFLRGIRFGFVPSTLLAQVDAAIGGKNGVNLDGYKNLIGVFNPPEFILLDPELLSTLPESEKRCGLAEIIKYGLISDSGLFQMLEKQSAGLPNVSPGTLRKTILRSISIKIRIAGKDFRESGERRKLNFGHTLGHALEKTFGLPHGDAVGWGMLAAARISHSKNLLNKEHLDRIESLIGRLNIPSPVEWAPSSLMKAIRRDKKRRGKDIHFVFLRAIGKSIICAISLKELEEAVHDLRQLG